LRDEKEDSKGRAFSQELQWGKNKPRVSFKEHREKAEKLPSGVKRDRVPSRISKSSNRRIKEKWAQDKELFDQ